MKRDERLALIREIVAQKMLSTQEELQAELAKKGVDITQATLSRDMRELGIIKRREGLESYYSFMETAGGEAPVSLATNFARFVIKVARVSFMVVVHTHLGEADLLANALDDEGREAILGTLAGADTLLITCASDEAAASLLAEIEDAI